MNIFLIIISLFIISSCYSNEVVKKPHEMYWPSPPAEPKIKFIEEISSREDVKTETKGGWLKKLIGGEQSVEDRPKRPYGVAVDRDGRQHSRARNRRLLSDYS